MSKGVLKTTWVDRGFEPRNPPDPDYPDGIDCDVSNGASQTCSVALPHPARRCGYWLIKCDRCGANALITTAGRIDDPRSATLACKGH